MCSLAVPFYLSAELFDKILKSLFGDEAIKIVEVSSKAALAVGENYGSDIFRTTVTYSTAENAKQTILLIVKCSPQNKMIAQAIEKLGIFGKEAFACITVLPAINDILANSGEISAKCIYYQEKPNSLLVFEDLSAKNFKMYPRQQGLDLQHCLLVVDRIACLHAGSLLLHEKDSTLTSKYTKGFFVSEFCIKWIAIGFQVLTEACLTWPGFEKYNPMLIAIKDTLHERVLAAKEPGTFNVLNHGDSWTNNFMFSYDSDGKLEDLRLVDFQLVFYGSPVIDLIYFWTTSPNVEVRELHLNTLLDRYHRKLVDVLTKLQYPLSNVPSRSDLQKDFNRRMIYGFAAAITVLPIVTASNRKDASIEDIIRNGNEHSFRHDAYNNERYKKCMEYLLTFYDSIGIFNDNAASI